MNRKFYLFALAIVLLGVILAVSIGSVKASASICISATPTGTVPLNTKACISVDYSNTNEMCTCGVLTVWYRASPCDCWTTEHVLFSGGIGSCYSSTFQYQLAKPGYYMFSWAASDYACETQTVSATVGPVLPEPAPIAGLGVSIAALGLVFIRKRFTK